MSFLPQYFNSSLFIVRFSSLLLIRLTRSLYCVTMKTEKHRHYSENNRIKMKWMNWLQFWIWIKREENIFFWLTVSTLSVHLCVFCCCRRFNEFFLSVSCEFYALFFSSFFLQRLFLNTRNETVTSHVLKVGTIKITTLDAIENIHTHTHTRAAQSTAWKINHKYYVN